jgi:hypothetical protein
MAKVFTNGLSRRSFLAGTAASLGVPAIAQDVDGAGSIEIEQ